MQFYITSVNFQRLSLVFLLPMILVVNFIDTFTVHATVQSFGPLLDTSAVRGKNMKHSDHNKGTSPTTGDARPVYTTEHSSFGVRHGD